MADSITELFMNRQPSFQETLRAMHGSTQSIVLGKPQSFGDALNNIRGAKIKEAVQFENIQQGRRRLAVSEETVSIRQMELGLKKVRQTRKDWTDAFESVTKDVSLKDRAKLFKWAKNHSSDTAVGNIRENLYSGIQELGIKEGVKPRERKSSDDIPYVVTDTRGEEAVQFTITRSQVPKYSGIPGVTVTSSQLQGGTKDIMVKARQRKLGGRSAEAETSAVARSGNIAKISGLLDQYKTAGAGVTGLTGATANIGGAVLGQFNQAAAEGWTKFFAGVSQGELSNLRTRAREAIARAIAPYSGEESGRFSEPERRLAETAQPLLEVDATWEQIRSALEVTISLEYITRDREIGEAGQPQSYDVATPQGRAMMAQELERLGLGEAAAAQTIVIVITQRELIAGATGAGTAN